MICELGFCQESILNRVMLGICYPLLVFGIIMFIQGVCEFGRLLKERDGYFLFKIGRFSI